MSIMKNNSVVILLVLLLAFCGNANGQGYGDSVVWRKHVSHLMKIEKDTEPSVFATLLKNIRSGKINIYNPYFQNKMSLAGLDSILYPQPDTVHYTDPQTGKDSTEIAQRKIDQSTIHEYKVFENWRFHPRTLEMEISITEFKPQIDVRGPSGDYRGPAPLCSINLAENGTFFKSPDGMNVLQTIFYAARINHFQPSPKTQEAKKTVYTLHSIDMGNTIVSPGTSYLFDQSEYGNMAEAILEQIDSMHLKAYNFHDLSFTKVLTVQQVHDANALTPDQNITCRGGISATSYGFIHNYLLLTKWEQDMTSGQITAQIEAIAPIWNIISDTGTIVNQRGLYWLRLDDIQGIISENDSYHPTSTFAEHVWDGYFSSEEKPEVVW